MKSDKYTSQDHEDAKNASDKELVKETPGGNPPEGQPPSPPSKDPGDIPEPGKKGDIPEPGKKP